MTETWLTWWNGRLYRYTLTESDGAFDIWKDDVTP